MRRFRLNAVRLPCTLNTASRLKMPMRLWLLHRAWSAFAAAMAHYPGACSRIRMPPDGILRLLSSSPGPNTCASITAVLRVERGEAIPCVGTAGRRRELERWMAIDELGRERASVSGSPGDKNPMISHVAHH